MIEQLKNTVFRVAHLFKGYPVVIDGESFRIDESLRRFNLETEKELQDAFSKYIKKGITVFDIGANFGLHTLAIARKIGDKGKIYAFEPIPSNLSLLRRNVKLNNFESKVTIVDCAVSNSTEPSLEMSIPQNEEIAVAASLKNNKGNGHVINVANTRLDDFVKLKKLQPDLMKIDVEGAELEVLRGAVETLRQFRPVILAEIHTFALSDFGTNCEDLISFMQKNEYSMQKIGDTQGKEGDYFHAVFLPFDYT